MEQAIIVEANLRKIFSQFETDACLSSFERLNNGHINESWHILTSDPGNPGYVLQKINQDVFRDIPGLMQNIRIVTDHLASKAMQLNGNQKALLQLVLSKMETDYILDKNGEAWRMYNYVAGSIVYNLIPGPAIAREGGKAFGEFMLLLSDLSPEKLAITIPHFHDVEKRWIKFLDALEKDTAGRKSRLINETAFVLDRYQEMRTFYELVAEGVIPQRITHNDTKFNNILFNSLGRPLCIVDLDTVMPGSALFDFGDAIRTATNTASEDEEDLSRVNFDIQLYEAYTAGYMEKAAPVLTRQEKDYLAFSARYMTFLIGLRFLTDYLEGDVYYRTRRPEHNLDRARVQFRMLEEMEKHFPLMEQIVKVKL